MNKKIKGIFELILIIAAFLFSSYIIQTNLLFLENLVTNDILGMIIYLILEISSIVIAPITTIPLIVIATNLWGWIATGILNIIGWMIGSWIAFIIARKYGIKIIRKFISLEKISEIEKKIPRKNIFWSIVLLRMIIPTDVLSYALGIFTKIKIRTYLLATLIGITPIAFLISYLGGIDIYIQIILVLIAGIILILFWILKLTCKKCSKLIKKNKNKKFI